MLLFIFLLLPQGQVFRFNHYPSPLRLVPNLEWKPCLTISYLPNERNVNDWCCQNYTLQIFGAINKPRVMLRSIPRRH